MAAIGDGVPCGMVGLRLFRLHRLRIVEAWIVTLPSTLYKAFASSIIVDNSPFISRLDALLFLLCSSLSL